MGVLVDSSVLIAGERGDPRVERLIEREPESGISVVTVAEYWRGAEAADTAARRARRVTFFESLTASVEVLDVDVEIARISATLWVDLAGTGGPIPSFDLLIAATAISRGWRLATLDVRHLGRIASLELLTL